MSDEKKTVKLIFGVLVFGSLLVACAPESHDHPLGRAFHVQRDVTITQSDFPLYLAEDCSLVTFPYNASRGQDLYEEKLDCEREIYTEKWTYG